MAKHTEVVMPCAVCGKEVRGSANEMYRAKKRGRAYCSPDHMRQMRYRLSAASKRIQVTMGCAVCGALVTGTATEMDHARTRGRAYCSTEHARQWASQHASEMRRTEVVMPCLVCGKEVRGTGTQMSSAKKRGRAYCSPEHAAEMKLKSDEANGRALGTKFAATSSARMKTENPMRIEAVREKMSATLREMGWRPTIRGGNGHGPTIPQQRLATALGWPCEVVVGTGMDYLPRNYKIDIADPVLKIAIEVDGPTHNSLSVRAADARKDEWLRGHEWTVLRFSNRAVMERLEECVQTVSSTISKLTGLIPTLPTAS